MSFVVLSNNKQEDGITATQGSIDKPYQFRNQLSATYEMITEYFTYGLDRICLTIQN